MDILHSDFLVVFFIPVQLLNVMCHVEVGKIVSCICALESIPLDDEIIVVDIWSIVAVSRQLTFGH